VDKFNKLPLEQKIGVILAGMAVFAGLIWYALISPVEDEMIASQAEKSRMTESIEKLRTFIKDSNVKDRAGEKKKLEAEKAKFETMLPRRERLAQFITEVADIAREAGLNLRDIRRGEFGQQDYYLELPIHMSVQGRFGQLTGFFQTLAEAGEKHEGGRVVNIRNLELETMPLEIGDRIMVLRQQRTKAGVGVGKDVNEEHIKKVDTLRAYDDVLRSGVQLKASFDAFVFTYTGEEATPEAARENKTRLKEIHERRKKRLKVGSYQRNG
jgi:Tfp pilus assembly protein PilO